MSKGLGGSERKARPTKQRNTVEGESTEQHCPLPAACCGPAPRTPFGKPRGQVHPPIVLGFGWLSWQHSFGLRKVWWWPGNMRRGIERAFSGLFWEKDVGPGQVPGQASQTKPGSHC